MNVSDAYLSFNDEIREREREKTLSFTKLLCKNSVCEFEKQLSGFLRNKWKDTIEFEFASKKRAGRKLEACFYKL